MSDEQLAREWLRRHSTRLCLSPDEGQPHWQAELTPLLAALLSQVRADERERCANVAKGIDAVWGAEIAAALLASNPEGKPDESRQGH